jgi:hypothetical protein
MDTYIINSLEEFNMYFNGFRESAKVGSVPETFLVGLDTEYIAVTYTPKWVLNTPNNIAVCLLQLASNTQCLVINLVKLNCLPNKLIKLLTQDCYIKVGIGIELDLYHLSNNYNLGHCGGGIELKNIALLAHHKHPNLETLHNQLIATYKKNISGVCNWAGELTMEQITYAARDAIMSLKVFTTMIQPTLTFITTHNQDVLNLNIVNIIVNKSSNINYIGMLNNMAQKLNTTPTYNTTNIDNNFKCVCNFNNQTTEGLGSNKKTAKSVAAQKMCNLLQL